jgi:cytochrome c55X
VKRFRIASFAIGSAVCAASTGCTAQPPDAARRQDLIRLVRQDCGSCHGLSLGGGLGSALLPQSLRDKPEQALVETVLDGRPGTAMPPWKTMLSRDEAAWIVSQLVAGFPIEPP